MNDIIVLDDWVLNSETTELNLPDNFAFIDGNLCFLGDCVIPISSKLEVIAVVRDKNSSNWGKLLCFKNPDGIRKEIIIHNSLLAGDDKEIKRILLSEGLRIYPQGEPFLKLYIQLCNPKDMLTTIHQIGWFNQTFILPNCKIGEDKNIYFETVRTNNNFNCDGTLQEWQENIGKYCAGNSRLIFAVSIALAAPLLHILGIESGGFHIIGASSCGKTTMLKVAASIWSDKQYIKTWRATDNGLEGIASQYNDSLLILDELGQVNPAKAGEIAYLLSNGRGKIRAEKTGAARDIALWRLLFLSSGEVDLEDCANESGKNIRAGQEVRLLSIPACPSEESYGIFENLHEFSDGAKLADYLNDAVNKYYGEASREYIKLLIKLGFDSIVQMFEKYKEIFEEKTSLDGADSQVIRAVKRFALIGFAGECAIKLGILPIKENSATAAILKCFSDWLEQRGGKKNKEGKYLLEQVKYFFELNSNSRFIDIKDSAHKVRNKAGYKELKENVWVYYVLPEVFKKELCIGIKPQLAKKILVEEKWLESEKSVVKKVGEVSTRVYVFNSSIWGKEL